MRSLIRRFIVWALGDEPLAARQWTCLIQGDRGSWTMMVKQYEYPPRVLVIPVVECREWAEGEMPEEGKTRVLALDESYHTARVAIYRDTGRVITG